MEDDAFVVLAALKRVNDTLLEGLKAAVFILENEGQMSDEKRASLVTAIKGLIKQSEEACGRVPKTH